VEPNVDLILVKPMAKTFTKCKVLGKFIEKYSHDIWWVSWVKWKWELYNIKHLLEQTPKNSIK
jgi:hypothetical protein